MNTKYDEWGRELPDPKPMAIPVEFKRAETQDERIRRILREDKLRVAANAVGVETPEEADDFEVGDDFEVASPYEYDFDHVNELHPDNPGFVEESPDAEAKPEGSVPDEEASSEETSETEQKDKVKHRASKA